MLVYQHFSLVFLIYNALLHRHWLIQISTGAGAQRQTRRRRGQGVGNGEGVSPPQPTRGPGGAS